MLQRRACALLLQHRCCCMLAGAVAESVGAAAASALPGGARQQAPLPFAGRAARSGGGSSRRSSSSSSCRRSPCQQQQQQQQDQPPLPELPHAAASRQHHYHAAAAADWHEQQQLAPQPPRLPPQRQRQGDAISALLGGSSGSAQRPGLAGTSLGSQQQQQQQATAVLAAPAGGDSTQHLGAFALSSFEEQYTRTLERLHMGHSRNLDQLAQLFDPAALLQAPDKGAAVLEALMFGAAKLGDLQLLRQLLRCMAAAGAPLSTSGHTAVLHCLAHCGRPREALEWLTSRVAPEQLGPHLVRALVQPLLKAGHVQHAEQALAWAMERLGQQQQQQPQSHAQPQSQAQPQPQAQPQSPQPPPGGHSPAAGSAAPAGLGPAGAPADVHQALACLRLMVAGAKAKLAGVQAEWAAIGREAAEQQEQLSVPVLASLVVALGRAARKDHANVEQACQLMSQALHQLADTCHAVAWQRWCDRAAAWQEQQQQDAWQEQPADCAASDGAADAAAAAPAAMDALLPATAAAATPQQLQAAAAAARQRWRTALAAPLSKASWAQLDAASVLPQAVVAALHVRERSLCLNALEATMRAACSQVDGAMMAAALRLGALLKLMPREDGFDALLGLELWQGAPPEALEELLGELMGWGVVPSLAHYEQVMEAHALHGDLAAAEDVLDRLQAAGHTPLLRTYNRLLHGIAAYGDLAAAARVHRRLKLQGVPPDMQTMRCLFKAVRMYATRLRVTTARQVAHAKPGDKEAITVALSRRSALFASAYSQLALWQGELVAAGLKHTPASMTHLTSALERLGAVEDCLQLARLHETRKPGTFTAHRAALKVAGRARDVTLAGEAKSLAGALAAGGGLSRSDYLALINSQFWVTQDHQQMLDTVAAMTAAGHALDDAVMLQVLHVYAHNGDWAAALRVLDDVAAGRVAPSASAADEPAPGEPRAAPRAGWWRRRHAAQAGAPGGGAQAAPGLSLAQNDRLWHVVLRKLWEQRASDGLLNEFLARMPASQRQRFKAMYGLRALPGEPGRFSLQPPEDWEAPPAPAQAPAQAAAPPG